MEIRNSDSYMLTVQFPAKDDKAKGQGIQQSPLKKRASGVVASQHKDQEQGSSDVRLVAQPKQKKKKKKTPSCVARDRRRRRKYWNQIKVARQLSAENLSAHYTKLQESRTVASPQSPVVSHSECQLEHSHLNSATSSHLAIEPETSVRSDVNELSVDEAEQNDSVDSESDDSQFRKHLLSYIPEPGIEPPDICSYCDKEGELKKCTGCRFVRYCSKKCQAADWPFHRELCKAIQSLPGLKDTS